jgi:MFS family permease
MARLANVALHPQSHFARLNGPMPRDSISKVRSPGTIFAAMGAIAISFAGSTLVTPLYALYQARFGFSAVTLTIVYAAYVIGNAAALFFLGRISDRIGRRPVAFAAIALCALASAVFLVARNATWLFVGRIVTGLAVGLGSGTGTAWLSDLQPDDHGRATLLSAEANMGGIGAAPLVAGTLAAVAPAPLITPFIVYIAVMTLVAIAIGRARETVSRGALALELFRPAIGLPNKSRGAFLAAAITGFVVFGFVGFYAALLPSLLRQSMGLHNPAIGGAILGELFAVTMITMPATRRLSSRKAMLAGLATIIPGLCLLVVSRKAHSLLLLILGTACGGITLALGYRGSLEVVNTIAPPNQKAGVVSAYFLACFSGNALPVIGVGVLTMDFGPVAASEIFAVIMLALAVAGFVIGLSRYPRQDAG